MGKRGHNLMRHLFGHSGHQVVAVCEVEGERREHAKNMAEEYYAKKLEKGSYKGCDAYVDFRKVIERKDIDAVVIATPDHWHAIPVVAAALAKKDIYCEKPLTLTIGEARTVADEVKKQGVIFQTGSQQRSECGGRFHRACELVRNGRIGKILTVHASVGGPSGPCNLPTQPTPANVDWNRWLGPAPWRGYNEKLCPKGMHNHYPQWRSYKDYSGGGMTDWGAHHFDIAQWGLGMDESGPVEIYPPDGKEHKTLTYKYANGVLLYHGGPGGVRFTGTDGWIQVDRSYLKFSKDSLKDEKIGENEIHLYKAHSHMGNWLECVRERKQPICPAEVGARSVTVCHLGNLAYWHKRPLKWDPEKYRFVDDAEANSWIHRPMREPWKL
jgi:predicted dehydrogenase